MTIITDDRCTAYSYAGHPERPGRVALSVKRLKGQAGLPLDWASPDPVEDAVLLRAHTPEHLARLRQKTDFDADTPFFERIEEHARRAVGAGLAGLRVARGGTMAFSLMRPPGHHAARQRAMGFCYLNNAAIVALEALATGSRRVAVYDFDVHHGNGTEAILLDRPGTAVYSIHQHPCYPGTGARNVGGNCYNFPVPPQTARGEYRQILASALDHLRQFKPDLVAVSAGFDAYAHDPLAQEMLEAEDYHWLGDQMRRLEIPVLSLLEGGYSEDLPDLLLAYLKGLAGQ